ncbi:protein TIFY 7-like [Bidens hawaiensis]|uniref:protein TIFY 7-like n=1 Tax=Bidens hawaiensis TaxID=980011 RepID=UPI00404A355A
MERDFMGLNSKDSVVKDEAVDGCKDSGISKNSAVNWPLSGADGFEGPKNRQTGEIQKSIGKQVVPISVSHPFYRAQFGSASFKQHGVAIPSIGSFLAGTTEPYNNNSKASCAPAQLTIFYGGMVNVYDDISPEKAQAIMLLAGNGASASTPQARVQTQVPVYVNQPVNPQTCSAISSPMSVSSHPLGPTHKDEGAKAVKGSVAHVNKVDSPRVISSLEEVIKSAVPQARKASLARFLEKRKERVMSSAPYNVTKDSIVNGGPSNMNAVAAADN